jgi:hypothetical protein
MVAAGEADVLVFTNANQATNVLRVAREDGLEAQLRSALGRAIVASIGPTCSEALRAYGLPVDLEPSHPKMGTLLFELAVRAGELLASRRAAGVGTVATPVAPAVDERLRQSDFLRACRREPVARTPIWLRRVAISRAIARCAPRCRSSSSARRPTSPAP